MGPEQSKQCLGISSPMLVYGDCTGMLFVIHHSDPCLGTDRGLLGLFRAWAWEVLRGFISSVRNSESPSVAGE